MENPGGPQKGKAWFVKRVDGCAGPANNRWYHIVWCHPQDPCAGMLSGYDGFKEFVYDPDVHLPPHEDTWEHECMLFDGKKNTAQRLITAYFKHETRPGFYPDGPCHDPEWIRCTDCNEFFGTKQELSAHRRVDCEYKPPSRSGTKAWKAARRHLLNTEGCQDLRPVVMSDAADDESANPAGTEVPFVIDGEVLGSIVSGDGSIMPDINARLAIGRSYFNRLYRTYSNKKLDLDLRLSMFQACVIGTASYGSETWFYTKEVCAKINGWASRMLSAITERTAHEEASDPVTNVVARFESRQLKAVGKILRGHDESPARIALLKILFLIDIKAIPKEETVPQEHPEGRDGT